MSRRDDRCKAYEMVFSAEFHEDKAAYFELERSLADDKLDWGFIRACYFGIYDRVTEIDSSIQRYSMGFTLARIKKTDLAALRLSIYEIQYSDTPPKVALNEAIELSKEYTGEESYRFVNGILAKIMRVERRSDDNLEG